MSKAKKTNRLKELLKPDIVIDLDKRVTNPFDLLQLQVQRNQIADGSTIESFVDQVIKENPGAVQDYRDGKQKAIGFLVGQVMKATRGKANPQMVNQLLQQQLNS